MNTVLDAPTGLLGILCAALCFIGAAILGYARRRRRGEAPHCRGCGYQLTGPDHRCAECGHAHEKKPARTGARSPSALLTIAGVLIIVLALVPGAVLGVRTSGVNIYAYAPAGYVLSAARSGEPEAITELHARAATGAMDARADAVVEMCLREIGSARLYRDGNVADDIDAWLSTLITLHQRGYAGASDLEPVFDRLITIKPHLTRHDSCYVTFNSFALRNSPGWALDAELRGITVNGLPNPGHGHVPARWSVDYFPSPPGFSSAHMYPIDRGRWSVALPGVRRHDVELKIRLVVRASAQPGAPVLYDAVRTVAETLPAPEPAPFVDDIDLARRHFSSFACSVSPKAVSYRNAPPLDASVVCHHEVTVFKNGVALDFHHLCRWIRHAGGRKTGGTSGLYPDDNATIANAGDRVDVVFMPIDRRFGTPGGPPILGYGARYEGLEVVDSMFILNTPIPRPSRIVLLDRNGNDLEELEISNPSQWEPGS